jgi:1-acyl-sn-glycerol-3-phosphate acyltransferase
MTLTSSTDTQKHRATIRPSEGNDHDVRDPAYIERTNPFLLRIGRKYFRSEVRGFENIPQDGPALLVGNHSGGFFIMDSFVFAAELYARFGANFPFHALIHDFVKVLPGYPIARKFGAIAAKPENAVSVLRSGAKLLVYPGGDHESFRPFWEANKISFAGRKGFIKLALSENVPIVPVVAIGGQETALFLARGRRLARWLGIDRTLRMKVMSISFGFPFGFSVLDFPPRIPLPSKITIQVLPRIDLRARFGANPDLDEVYAYITGEMQRALDALARERKLPVLG